MSTFKPVSEQELTNIRHTLDLLTKQMLAGRIETDYATRQIEKVKDLLERMAQSQIQRAAAVRFETLYEVTRLLGSSLDMQTVLDQVMDGVIKLTGAERGFLMLRDDDGNLRVEAARNLDQQTLSSSDFGYSQTITNMVLDRGEAVVTTNAVEDPRFKDQQSIMSQALRSIMAVPLRARGRVIGIAYVENRVIAGLFNEDDLNTLEALAGQASIAIDNALLFSETDEALSKRVEELRELRRIDMILNQKLDPDDAMLYTLETACRLSGAMVGHLGLLQGDPAQAVATHHYQTDGVIPAGTSIILDEQYPQIVTALNSHRSFLFKMDAPNPETVLIVPVMRERNPVGAVVLRRTDGSPFSSEQQDMVERVVSRAAVTIENARLYVAVQAADKAKSEFVGIVAHDLKAPMTSIRGYADLMAMQGANLDERQHRFLSRISNTVKRMEMLVSDLADISRIESGQFLMNEMNVSVAQIVETVRDTIAPQMQERNHQFIERIAPGLPDLYTDYYRLVQVLTNLLSNAYKYTPDGGTITLEIRPQNQRVRFAVSDTGIGLTPEGIVMLGTKFWRAEDQYTRSQPGTGLGFSITASLVEQMGSKIEIQSEPGKGSTFAFSVGIFSAMPHTR
jgi:signal transduction histidine kinase